ncbi:MAG: D-glycerate dehydrogenase [Chloroflexi bacterium]|nr:D-glycerate dehydrogenase [Chloroflexota bacterium]MBT4073833.1 D-glycerate dehydrogenase [Chloroflexota bacterium]MBT4516124.1 D-glycerate dehydrogenase [Chloroflexota bacterium]MBT6682263.1 D-glycerate dehydrogenase [Chloroflexota bacterium]
MTSSSSSRPKILVTRRQFQDQVDRLNEVSDALVLDRPAPAKPDELRVAATNAHGIFAHITDAIDASVMDAAGSNLKVIAEFGVGYDNIDVDVASERNIAVANTPGVLTETAADFGFTMIQAAGRRIAESDRFVRRGEWQWFEPLDLLGVDIYGSTLGIVGFGRIGSAVARRAVASGMNVIYLTRSQPEEDYGCERVNSLNELLERSDFVSIHCPLTPETNQLIGAAELKRMKPEASLINTARGPIVDTEALTTALQNGDIAYAALDVTDPEPIAPDHPLVSLENVTIVPHIASATVGTRRKMSEMTVENILATLNGKLPPNCVNADRINWG